MFSGFALQYGVSGKEEIAVALYSTMHKIPLKKFQNPKDVPVDYMPVGNVEWCSSFLKNPAIPDYYPLILKKHLYREVWKTNEWPLGRKVFIKPADSYKRFTGFVTNGRYKGKKKGPYICSDVVTFVNEWRYYVAEGKVLTAEWYDGDEINTPDAPPLDVTFSEDYCGAVDFGTLTTGQLALVEAQHPYACGWYGKNHEIYVDWLIKGWQYMLKNHS